MYTGTGQEVNHSKTSKWSSLTFSLSLSLFPSSSPSTGTQFFAATQRIRRCGHILLGHRHSSDRRLSHSTLPFASLGGCRCSHTAHRGAAEGAFARHTTAQQESPAYPLCPGEWDTATQWRVHNAGHHEGGAYKGHHTWSAAHLLPARPPCPGGQLASGQKATATVGVSRHENSRWSRKHTQHCFYSFLDIGMAIAALMHGVTYGCCQRASCSTT